MSRDKEKSDISYLPRSWGDVCCRKTNKGSCSPESLKQPDGSDWRRDIDPRTVESLTVELCNDPDHEENDAICFTASSESLETVSLEYADSVDTEDVVEPCSEVSPDEGISGLDELQITDYTTKRGGLNCIRARLAGIRFGYACKVYHFDAGEMDLDYGEWVVVKTEKGMGLGQVAIPPYEREIDSTQAETLRRIIRKGGKVDIDQRERCCQRESEAYTYCVDKVEELGLPMKLVSVECFFDGSKYVFYFTSEGRVDFRELVKFLVSRFPVRIEMRQIGVRHEAKMTGGIACCGQELCCSRFLTDFRPVSVKMAKNQNLSLNPAKISGVCGRLMCCLSYEHDVYEEFIKGVPRVGKLITTTQGEGCVLKHNPLEETILVKLSDDSTAEVRREEILGEVGPDTARKTSTTGAPPTKPPRKASGKRSHNTSVSEEL